MNKQKSMGLNTTDRDNVDYAAPYVLIKHMVIPWAIFAMNRIKQYLVYIKRYLKIGVRDGVSGLIHKTSKRSSKV